MVSFKPSQKTTVGLVVHANSITLTPGTITVEARPGEFLVHALTRAGAEGTTSGDMDRRVSALRRGPLMFAAVGIALLVTITLAIVRAALARPSSTVHRPPTPMGTCALMLLSPCSAS